MFQRPLSPMFRVTIASILTAAFSASAGEKPVNPVEAKPASKAMIDRGAYLVSFASCNDCHTPMKLDPVTHAPGPDMDRMLSGHPEGAKDPTGKLGETDMAIIGGTFTAFLQPFGTVYVANITPDRETGLGTWTEAMFIQSMRTGRHLGGQGRPILPPMPWYGLATLTDADLKAIFAYLRTVPPVHNAVPDNKVPTPVLAEMAQSNQEILKHLKIPNR